MIPFNQRLLDKQEQLGQLCVGIDPHESTLEKWELPFTSAGVERFSLSMVEAAHGEVASMKPQLAFFERFGSAGVAVYERVVSECKDADILTIADAKRGDIGTTMEAYALSFLAPGPMKADSLTVNPFLGFASLEPAIQVANANKAGLFVLALTSNEGSQEFQDAKTDMGSISQTVVQQSQRAGLGIVVGATHPERIEKLDLSTFTGPILVPGIGAQGGDIATCKKLFGSAWDYVTVNSSRGISNNVGNIRDAIRRTQDELKA